MYDTNILNNIPEKAESVSENPVRESPLPQKKIISFQQQLYRPGIFPDLEPNIWTATAHFILPSGRSSRAKPVKGGTSQVVFLKTLFWEMMFGISEITSGECLYIHDHMREAERPAVKRDFHTTDLVF